MTSIQRATFTFFVLCFALIFLMVACGDTNITPTATNTVDVDTDQDQGQEQDTDDENICIEDLDTEEIECPDEVLVID